MKLAKVFLLILFLILFAYIIFFRNGDYTKCTISGGRWEIPPGPTGRPLNRGYCYHPPNDEGKTCYQNSDCQSDCIASSRTDDEGYILGKCGEYSIFTCVPTIPNKTKNRESLQRGGCV